MRNRPPPCTLMYRVVTPPRSALGCAFFTAGITNRGSLADTAVDTWDRIMNTNLRSVFLLTQGVSNMMKVTDR